MANKKTKGAPKAAKAVVAEAPSPAVKRGKQQALTDMNLPEDQKEFIQKAKRRQKTPRENVYGGRMQLTPDDLGVPTAKVRGARDVSEF